jgi:hypothetical protein
MYGEGYDYAPLYGPNPGDIVGALPVGMDCMHGDTPYWDGCNIWTYKEIWVLPVNRFLWTAAYLGMPGLVKGAIKNAVADSIQISDSKKIKTFGVPVSADQTFAANLAPGEYSITFEDYQRVLRVVQGSQYQVTLDPLNRLDLGMAIIGQNTGVKSVTASISAKGTGTHELDIRIFNGRVSEPLITINLGNGNEVKSTIKIEVIDPSVPWVVVAVPDHDLTLKEELTGCLNEK